MKSWWQPGTFGLMLYCVALGGASVPVRGQSQDILYQGRAKCFGCHEKPSSIDIEKGVTQRVCMIESSYWNGYDRHSLAYESLKGERGRRIGKLLGNLNVLDPATGCVQCHTTAVDTKRTVAGELDESLTEGVGCEACHGASTRWINPHSEFVAWQKKKQNPRATAELGWIDMNSPVARAEVCNSCHVGSAKDNRLITHAMYAAGHPPLSGFDIETFADKMPRHWRYSYELPNPNVEVISDPSYVRTRNLLIGSVVAMRTAVELAMADAAAPDDADRWPELARLDCFACHHDVGDDPTWRQFRQASTTPGRPQIAVSSTPLVAIAAELAKDDAREDVASVMNRLRKPFEQDVFGDRAKLAVEGAAVVAWCRSLEVSLAKMDFGSQNGAVVARTVLRDIANRGRADLYDYDTTRQILGAWLIVYDELEKNQALGIKQPDRARLDAALRPIRQNDPLVLERDRLKSPCQPPPDNQQAETEAQREAGFNTLFDKRASFNPTALRTIMRTMAEVVD